MIFLRSYDSFVLSCGCYHISFAVNFTVAVVVWDIYFIMIVIVIIVLMLLSFFLIFVFKQYKYNVLFFLHMIYPFPLLLEIISPPAVHINLCTHSVGQGTGVLPWQMEPSRCLCHLNIYLGHGLALCWWRQFSHVSKSNIYQYLNCWKSVYWGVFYSNTCHFWYLSCWLSK